MESFKRDKKNLNINEEEINTLIENNSINKTKLKKSKKYHSFIILVLSIASISLCIIYLFLSLSNIKGIIIKLSKSVYVLQNDLKKNNDQLNYIKTEIKSMQKLLDIIKKEKKEEIIKNNYNKKDNIIHNKNISDDLNNLESFDKFLNLLKEYNITDINQGKTKIIYEELKKLKNKRINIKKPIYSYEKLYWLTVFDNIPIKTKLTDKIQVCDYALEKLGKDICVPKLKIYDKPEDINLKELPEKFILKTNHASGKEFYHIVRNKYEADQNLIINKFKKAIKTNFAIVSKEPHYYPIIPKVYAEKLIGDQNTDLKDYKIFCFNGEPKFLYVSFTKNKKSLHNFYDTNFTFYNISRSDEHHYDPDYIIEKPSKWELMIEYAKKLSKDFIHVRVDFYFVDNTIYLGELTFTTAGGRLYFKNKKDEKIIGDLFNLTNYPSKNSNYDKENLITDFPLTSIPFSKNNFK